MTAAPTKGSVMKASKLIVLVGGILGILAFFLPLVSVHRGGTTAKVSAMQVIKGLDAVDSQVDRADARTGEEVAMRGEAKQDIGAMKGIVLAIFAPAALLALLGGLGVARKRFGRGAGALSLLLGLVGLGIGAVLKSAAEGDAGIGMSFLLLTGVAGIVGGLAALIKPERLAAAAGAPALASVPRLAA
jgi:hypothetical protein